jgi:hypothetical protein
MNGNQEEEISRFLKQLEKEDEENEDEDIEHKISTTEPNMIVEIQTWKIDLKQLQITKTYESGFVIVDLEPYLLDYDESVGIDVNSSDFWILKESFNNPTYTYLILHDLTEEELNNIKERLGTEFDDELEKLGWNLYEKEIWFKGRLNVEKF